MLNWLLELLLCKINIFSTSDAFFIKISCRSYRNYFWISHFTGLYLKRISVDDWDAERDGRRLAAFLRVDISPGLQHLHSSTPFDKNFTKKQKLFIWPKNYFQYEKIIICFEINFRKWNKLFFDVIDSQIKFWSEIFFQKHLIWQNDFNYYYFFCIRKYNLFWFFVLISRISNQIIKNN